MRDNSKKSTCDKLMRPTSQSQKEPTSDKVAPLNANESELESRLKTRHRPDGWDFKGADGRVIRARSSFNGLSDRNSIAETMSHSG